MSIVGAVLLGLSGLVCAPVAWGTAALSALQVRLLALFGALLAGAACILALQDAPRAPAWLAAPAAVIAAVGLGSALTVAALSATRVVGRATEAHVQEGPAATPVLPAPETPEAPADPGSALLRGGALIGVFERLAIASTLLAGWPEGLAVVLAVKGLGRFPELKQAHGQATSERFILGTLVSVLAAAGCAGVGLALRG
jgi:hypothetical protein